MLSQITHDIPFWIKTYSLIVFAIATLKILTDSMFSSSYNYSKYFKAFLGLLLIIFMCMMVIHIIMSLVFIITLDLHLIVCVVISFLILGKLAK